MEDLTTVFLHWKEIGGFGVALYLLFRLLVKVVDWMLELFGISLKRKQTREDDLKAENLAINAQIKIENAAIIAQLKAANAAINERLDIVDRRVTRVEEAYKGAAAVAHGAASGIEAEMVRLQLDCPTILFFTKQMHAITPFDEIFGD